MASSARLDQLAFDSKKFYGSVESPKENEDDKEALIVEPPKECWGTRHTLTMMSFLGMASLYAMRVNLSVAIVAMTNAGGLLAEKYGGKWFLCLGSLVTAVFTLLTPPAAKWGTPYLIGVRVLEGLGEGVTFPAMQVLISKWIPTQERSKLGAFIWGGTQAGTVFALLLSGFLAAEFGWEWVFYFFGIFGVVWCFIWVFICYDSPDKHPRISEATKLPFPPFAAILKTPAFLGLVAVHFGNNWGLYSLLTEIPTYLNNIQHFSIATNGLLSSLPYLLMWLLSSPVGYVADRIIVSGKMKTVNVRRLAQSISHYGAGIAMLAMANVGCNQTLAIVWLCVSMALTSSNYSGFQKLSPNYAGTLMGISNGLGTITGFVAPMLAGYLTNDNQTIEAWAVVFYLTAGIYFALNTIFVIFADSDVQPWNTYWEAKPTDKEAKKH